MKDKLFRLLLMKKVSILLMLLLSVSAPNALAADAAQRISEFTFLGLQLDGANKSLIEGQMNNLGGFKKARSTAKADNIDKFFPINQMRDSYFIQFRYRYDGELFSVKRLFRPQSTQFENRRDPIQTRQVALQIVKQIGQPTRIERKSWGGSPSYNAYIWENKRVKIVVDREGSEIYGNVFMQYQLKANPYMVADQGK